jgi:release factor glutamine methyltransferase
VHATAWDREPPSGSADVTDLPLAERALDGHVHDVADTATEHGAADRRGRGHHREQTVAAGAGERDAGAHRGEEERAALAGVLVLDLDDRAQADRGRAGQGSRAKRRERVDLGERLASAALLGAAEGLQLVRGARVLALLIGGRALAGLEGGGIARAERGPRRRLELAHQLGDEILLVHAESFATGRGARKLSPGCYTQRSVTTWTTLAVLDWTTQRFVEAGISSARLEAQLLLAHVLGCSRVQLYTGFDKPLGEDELAGYRALIKRRLGGEPVAYLLGEHEFWGLPFYVDPDVLVPRPDTETVIEVARSLRPDRAAPCRVLDLCTGSGAIAVSLARELPAATVVATDVSAAAAALARKNAERNAVAERVDVRVGDLWEPVRGERFDLIVSNPPYIASAVIATLSAEVQREPRLALDGGGDGMAFYDRICAHVREHLAPGGALVVEHGFDQAEAVGQRLLAAGLDRVTLVHDLGKNPRVTSGVAPA